MANNLYLNNIRNTIINESFLLLIIKVLSSESNISNQSLRNITRFHNSIDSFYSRDIRINSLLNTIKLLSEFRAKYGVINKEHVIYDLETYANDDNNEYLRDVIIPKVQNSMVAAEYELDQVDKAIENVLIFGAISNDVDVLSEICVDFSNSIGNEMKENADKLEKQLAITNQKLKDIHLRSNDSSELDIKNENFIQVINEVWEDTKSPNKSFVTGLKGLNQILGYRQGFIPGNLYLFYAPSNSFKSMLMLWIATWIVKYNGDKFSYEYTTKGIEPVVLLCSFENSYREDIERLYKQVTRTDIDNFENSDDAIKVWNDNMKKMNSCISINLCHNVSRSMTVTDINDRIDSIEENGDKKVISVIMDYVGIVRPESDDTHLQEHQVLKRITEQMLTMAKHRNIPVITAQQLNRSGDEILMASKNQGDREGIRHLGFNQIQGSSGINQTSSWGCFINLERDVNGKEYLSFKLAKSRGKRSSGIEDVFFYEVFNGMLFEEDIFKEYPGYKTSLRSDNEMVEDMKQPEYVGERGVINLRNKKVSKSNKTKNNNSNNIIKTFNLNYKNSNIPDDKINKVMEISKKHGISIAQYIK